VELLEEQVLDQATAARSIVELKAEITTLHHQEELAASVRRSGTDTKWRELASLFGEIFKAVPVPVEINAPDAVNPNPKSSPRQKLVIFTEHRDTLNYLRTRISTLLGRDDAVVLIHGGMGREDRIKAQEAFKYQAEVQVLLATEQLRRHQPPACASHGQLRSAMESQSP
jgi:superfamily II DNA/RNA helicase